MWYLVEDFFDQNIAMKGFELWGWLCMLIMASSLVTTIWSAIGG